ncbi:MAG: hypothetical protein KME29_04915 [Calothrix sp. FI2-JRJ7]|jgi:hypothetical protein|nr:hypothetical protein [Calothrix sp. FI2-JRJ7]
MQTYTQAQLETKTLKELKRLAQTLGAEPTKDARLKQSWVTAILGAMPQKVEELPSDTKVEAEAKTCADCPLFQAFNDGSGRGLCCGADRVARAHHQQTQDCLHLIEAHEEQPSDTKEEEYVLLPAGATQMMTAYHVKHQGLIVGMIFNVHRNNSWQCGDGQNYRYPAEAREALVKLTEAPLLKTHPHKYQSPDGALEVTQMSEIGKHKLWVNNKDKFYYSTYRDAEKSNHPVAVRCDDVKVGDKIYIAGYSRIVSDILQVPHLGINWTKFVCADGIEIKAPWYCPVQISAFPSLELEAA